MINADITQLISEMQEVQGAYPAVTNDQVLKLFNIAAMKELTNVIRSIKNG